VARAQEAADAVSAEVAKLTARLDAAEVRLTALQVEVAQAVTAHEQAQQQLVDAEAAARQAVADLGAARAAHESADDALAGQAALMYMQGGSLQNLAYLLFTPPNTMADLALVLDDGARETQHDLDAATAAESEAAARETELSRARDDREAAAAAASATRDAAEAKAAEAGTAAARLGRQQERLAARLEVLQQGADDLALQRAAAAGADVSALLGVQSDSLGAGPRAAQAIARAAMPDFGWDRKAEFACLVTLWHNESGWSWSATNRSSGAYGIPQALPGWKMASAGSDWLTNPATQIAWGMEYIETTYGSPCAALAAFTSRSPHWY
jgi:hypothetical protein